MSVDKSVVPDKSAIHMNNHLVCAVDVETTGTDPSFHEIIQLALLPLNSKFEGHNTYVPFDIKMVPDHLERIDMKALEVSKTQLQDIIVTGIPQEKGRDLFEYWFQRLNLGHTRRIILLGHNNTFFDNAFIQKWLGPTSYATYFDARSRDVMTVCNYLNDLADVKQHNIPFPKMKLRDVANALQVELYDTETHDALYDAMIAAKCYNKLLRHYIVEAF